jgi:FkbM family methyltransferase
MTTLRELAKRARGLPALNRPLTSAIRSVVRTPPEFAVTHLPRVGDVEVVAPGGTRVRFDSGDDWISSRMWWLGTDGFEPEALGPFLRLARDARVILDVGAYVGHYSLLAAAVNPSARVFAFEPVPLIAARLGRNLALNPELVVTHVPYAVGPSRGPARFHLGGPGMPSSSSLATAWEGIHDSIDVAVTDLDSFAEDWGVTDQVDLVKMDVESAEPGVVAGMAGLLRGSRPAIVTEVLPSEGAAPAYRTMSETLADAGYRFFHLRKDGIVPEDELTVADTYVDHVTTPVNHLACPAERLPDWL